MKAMYLITGTTILLAIGAIMMNQKNNGIHQPYNSIQNGSENGSGKRQTETRKE